MADKREVKLRVSPELHKVLKDQAHAEGVSINQLVTYVLRIEFLRCPRHGGFVPDLECEDCKRLEATP